MNFNMQQLKQRAPRVFSLERVVCRVIAAWCCYVAVMLFSGGEFLELSFMQGSSLAMMAGYILPLFLMYSVVNFMHSEFETDTWFLMLSATPCAMRWAYDAQDAKNEFLFLLAVIAAYLFFVLYFVQKNAYVFSRVDIGNRDARIAVALIGIVSCGVIAAFSVARYLSFSSPNFDFGLFCNMFHYMKETGLPLVTSERDVLMSHFGVHISPIYYLILPFYYIFPSPVTLQLAQAVVLASGIIPVYLLCKKTELSQKLTVLVCAIYAFYPALSAGCFYDIHENCFLTPLLLWMFYFFEKGKYPLMYLSAFLTLMVKEDAAVYVVIFALYVLFSSKKARLHGAVLALGSLAYFAIALSILSNVSAYYVELYADATPRPAINGPMINRFNNLIFDKEDGLLGALKTLLVNPGYALTQLFTESKDGWEKLVYALKMFLPLGFIPFCTKKTSRWLLAAPILMNLLTNYVYQYNIGFQYSFGITAFLVYATVLNLPELKLPVKHNLLAVSAAACCILYVATVLPFTSGYVNKYRANRDTYEQMEEILDTVPEDASVCVSSFLLAHVADRDVVYELNYHANEPDVDYVIIDMRYAVDETMLDDYLSNGYEVYADHEGLIRILAKSSVISAQAEITSEE